MLVNLVVLLLNQVLYYTIFQNFAHGYLVDLISKFRSLMGYVGILSGAANRLTLANLFNEQKEILEARFIYDRDNSRSSRFGFITWASDEGVEDQS